MTGSIKKRQQASIPSVPNNLPADMRAFLTSMRTALTVLQGDGNKNAELDRAVTLRELQDQVVNINPQAVIASLSNAGKGGSGSVKGDIDLFGITVAPPSQPTGVRVDVALNTAILSWDPANYGGHSHTEIFRQVTNLNEKGEPVDPPRFDEAKLIHGTSSSSVFVEPADSNKGYYYWVRHVNIRGSKSPLNSTEGVFGKNELQLDGGVIKPKTITGTSIMDDAIETEHLAANSVTSGKILAGSIGTNHLIAGSIVGDHIAAGAITGGKIAANTIDGGKIVAGTYIRSPIIEGGLITGNVIRGSTIEGTTINGTTIKGGRIEGAYITGAYGDFSGSFVVRPVTGDPVGTYKAWIYNGKPYANQKILLSRIENGTYSCFVCSGHSGCGSSTCTKYVEAWAFKFSIQIPAMHKETVLKIDGFHGFDKPMLMQPAPGNTLRFDSVSPFNELSLGENNAIVLRADTVYDIVLYIDFNGMRYTKRDGASIDWLNGTSDGTNPTRSYYSGDRLAAEFDKNSNGFAYVSLSRYSRI